MPSSCLWPCLFCWSWMRWSVICMLFVFTGICWSLRNEWTGLNSRTSSTTPMDTLLLHWISRNCWQRRAKKIKWILWMWLISPFFYLKMILCVELESFLFPLCTWAIFYQFYYFLVFIFLNNPLFRKVYELKSVLLQSNHESIIKKGWNEWMKKNHDSSKIISEFVKIITNWFCSCFYSFLCVFEENNEW